MIYPVFILLMSFNQLQSHPAFAERVEERNLLVSNEIKNDPFLPVRDSEVLDAMYRVPRHVFVPEEYQSFAYENRPLPIGYDQTISQPIIVAHMTELLQLEASHKVLEIGTGSGYQAAILAELCDSIYTMEIIRPLGEKAADILQELAYHQVRVRIGNGYKGWPEQAPFDRMIVTCAPDEIPEALIDQLAPGGRIVIPVGSQYETQYLVVVKKTKKGKIFRETQYPVRFVPMTGDQK